MKLKVKVKYISCVSHFMLVFGAVVAGYLFHINKKSQFHKQQHHQQDDLKTKVFTRTPSKAASHFDYF